MEEASGASQCGPAASGQRAYLTSARWEELLLAGAEEGQSSRRRRMRKRRRGRREVWGAAGVEGYVCVGGWGIGRGYWMLQGRRREPIREAIDQFPPLSHSWRARSRTESVRLTADWTHSQKHLDPPTLPPTPILQPSPTPDGRDRKSFAVAVYTNTGFTELKAHRPKPSFFENAPQGVFFENATCPNSCKR